MKKRGTVSKPGARSKAKASLAKQAARPSLRILFTCIGRRVELLDAFRRAASALDIDLTLHGADINWLAPAMYVVDKPHVAPRIKEPDYIPALLQICRRNRIDALIPLIDWDLLALADASEMFAELGTRVILSDADVIRICQDKMQTYRTLAAAGIDTPRTWTVDELSALASHRFPYFMKPREGSAGKGNYVIHNEDELHNFAARVDDPIVQEFVAGVEHTNDVYAGLDGVPRCAVPRRRLEVRTGEVSKGMVVKNPDVIETAMHVAKSLGHCRGVVTVQCMVTEEGRVRVIEINPRFGGGAPLAIHAGADFPKWLMAELIGRKLRYDPMRFRDGLTMLRFDQSVFVADVGAKRPRGRRG